MHRAGWVGTGAALFAGCGWVADLGQFDGASPAAVDASDASSLRAAIADAVAPLDSPAGDEDSGPYEPAVRYDFEQGTEGWDRNPYNPTQNWGIVGVAQAVDPTEVEAGPPAGGSLNHCLAISYDSSLKPESGASVSLEVVNAAYLPHNLGTVPGLTLSVDLYIDPDAAIGSPVEFGVQDSTYTDCFFVRYDTSDAGKGVWMTLSSNQTGTCGGDSGPTIPRQLSFQFVPQGAGTICIDNITW